MYKSFTVTIDQFNLSEQSIWESHTANEALKYSFEVKAKPMQLV